MGQSKKDILHDARYNEDDDAILKKIEGIIVEIQELQPLFNSRKSKLFKAWKSENRDFIRKHLTETEQDAADILGNLYIEKNAFLSVLDNFEDSVSRLQSSKKVFNYDGKKKENT